MKTIKRIFLIAFLTISLVFALTLKEKEVNAETYNETTLSCLYSVKTDNSSAFYMYGLLTEDLDPAYASEWLRYDGIGKLNGNPINMDIKFIGKGDFQGFYVEGYGEVKADDVLTLCGSFVNETKLSKIKFDNEYDFKYDGTNWTLISAIKEMKPSTIDPKANHIYTYSTMDPAVGLNWEIGYTGTGKLNDSNVNLLIKIVPNGATVYNTYIELPNNAQIGDMLTVSGEFTGNCGSAKVNVSESKFIWNGSTWNLPTEKVTASNLIPSSNQSSLNNLYATATIDGSLTPSWEIAYTGNAIIDGVTSPISFKYYDVNNFYLEGFDAKEGSTIILDGEYKSANNVVIVFNNERIEYKSGNWDAVYSTYNVKDMHVAYNQVANNNLYLYGTIEGNVTPSWEIPYTGYVLINGIKTPAQIKYTGHGELDDFYLEGFTVNDGDTLELSQEFKNQFTKVSLNFEELVLIYSNSKWDIEYKKYNVSNMILPGNQKSESNTFLVGVLEEGITPSWEIPYTGSVTLNGVKTPAQIKYTGHGEMDDFYLEGFTANKGDVLVINGEFKCLETGNSLVFEEFRIAYDGSLWRNLYNVKFLNYDGSVLLELNDTIGGTIVTYTGDTPTREADSIAHKFYTFVSWDKELTEITEDTIYTAVFNEELEKFTITFLNYDDSLITEMEVEYGKLPVYELDLPLKEGDLEFTYLFSSWSPELTEVTEEKTYKATFERYQKYFTVTFLNYDGEILLSKKFETGTIPEYTGSEPVKAGSEEYVYSFSGWTPEIKELKEDSTYTATFTESKKKVNVTFKDYDGTVLESKEVDFGDTPVYTGSVPSRKQSDEFKYTFSGWDKELQPAIEDATYTATYTEEKKTYTVTVKFTGMDLGNKTLTLEYGSIVKNLDFIKDGFDNVMLDSKGIIVDEIKVTGNMTITISYTEMVKKGCKKSILAPYAIVFMTSILVFALKRKKKLIE